MQPARVIWKWPMGRRPRRLALDAVRPYRDTGTLFITGSRLIEDEYVRASPAIVRLKARTLNEEPDGAGIITVGGFMSAQKRGLGFPAWVKRVVVLWDVATPPFYGKFCKALRHWQTQGVALVLQASLMRMDADRLWTLAKFAGVPSPNLRVVREVYCVQTRYGWRYHADVRRLTPEGMKWALFTLDKLKCPEKELVG